MLGLQILVVGSAIALFMWRIWVRSIWRQSASFPPGPPSHPILGHVHLIPGTRPELTYMKWAKEYNTNVLYLNLLQFHAVILSSVSSAVALLDKRGAIYSNRPRFQFFEEQGWKEFLTSYNPGPQFRKHRRMFQNPFTPANCTPYQGVQQKGSRKSVLQILRTPENWENHLLQYTTSIILGITYGIEVKDNNDAFVQIAEQITLSVKDHSTGMTAVDIFPFIRKLPDWFKLIPSLNYARETRPAIQAMRNIPFNQVKADMENGVAQPSFTLKMLEEMEQCTHGEESEDNVTEDDIKGAGILMYASGFETTLSTLLVFVLNMVRHLEVQQKAWAEIDAVVGNERLPTFEDRAKLPYVEHIVQETFRWNPTVPLSIPHVSAEDDSYNGMFIPKASSLIIANAYAMNHDETVYKNPSTFDPDRYISKEDGGRGEPFPVAQFGFGRRICPGRHLAEASIWINVATLLASLEFRKVIGEDGMEITPDPQMTTGITSHPESFRCRIAARSENVAELASRS